VSGEWGVKEVEEAEEVEEVEETQETEVSGEWSMGSGGKVSGARWHAQWSSRGVYLGHPLNSSSTRVGKRSVCPRFSFCPRFSCPRFSHRSANHP